MQDLPALIAQKQQELKDINDYRLQSLEKLLLDKENENRALRGDIARIKEDFSYNLSVRFCAGSAACSDAASARFVVGPCATRHLLSFPLVRCSFLRKGMRSWTGLMRQRQS